MCRKRCSQFISDLQEPTKDLMVFYGAGDHGGGPAKENIQSILDMQKTAGRADSPFQHAVPLL